MITVVAIDDEPLALSIIETYCKNTNEITLLRAFTEPTSALNYLNNYPVDLAFVDVKMQALSGFRLVEKIIPNTMVVFTTAYAEFAVQSYNVNALDYLLKPIEYERFLQSIYKAQDYLRVRDKKESNEFGYIFLRAEYQLHRIDLSKIVYLEAYDNYSKVHMVNEKPLLIRSTLSALLNRFPSGLFIRVHRSFAVPKDKIKLLESKSLLINGIEIPMGSKYKPYVKRILDGKND